VLDLVIEWEYDEAMVLLFFIYGLAFFVLGISIYIYPRKSSQFKLAESLWLIALFGISHGINEWVDMFIMIRQVNIVPLRILRTLLLPISFLFLVQFGINNIVEIKKKNPALKSIPLILFIVWGMITLASDQKFLLGDIFARYLLCLPGTVLTCYAITLHLPKIKEIKQGKIVRSAKIAAVTFLFYGFLAGLVVPQAGFFPASIFSYALFSDEIGIPVQVFRTCIAMVIAYAMNQVLSIFEFETVASLRKGHDELEGRVMERTASLQQVNLELKKAIIERHEKEEKMNFLASIVETIPDALCSIDVEGRIISWNAGAEHMLGYGTKEIIGQPISMLIPMELVKKELDHCINLLNTEGYFTGYKSVRVTKIGHRVPVEMTAVAIKDREQKIVAYASIMRDVSEQKKLEDQLRHAQKMEAIGQLAGGVAHDFNNILTAVIGYASLVSVKMPEDDPLRRYADDIIASSERAANLTKKLLTFSRRQVIELELINLNEIVRSVEKLLVRIIGEDIEPRIIFKETNLMVMVDSGQIEQVLMNLCTNARDAMSVGGTLSIETGLVELNEEYIRTHGYGKKGRYALLSVSDTGIGMDEKTKERIFEPFFTTKEMGKGTGLGLSMAYGIIKQHDGYINVYSEPGVGTTFKIYLPVVEGERQERTLQEITTVTGGTEVVLLAEDDAYVRKLAKEVLEEAGYTVVDAVDGEEAISIFNMNRGRISLLILDVLMPKKSGKEAYEAIREIRPDIRVLFTSGYTQDLVLKKGIVEEAWHLVMKPISPTELLRKVREVLDA